jgi:arylsulfatase A-like enzyme
MLVRLALGERMLRPLVVTSLLALAACGAEPSVAPAEPSPRSAARVLANGTPGNFLVIVLDDVSAQQVEAYGSAPGQPHTPTISALAAAGVRFDNAYTFASCTPSRAALLTGRYPARYGLGNAIDDSEPHSLHLAEVTLPEALRQSPYGYTSALIGKWHLNSLVLDSGRFGPLDQGFDYASGSLENLGSSISGLGDTDYFHWERVTNGRPEVVDGYATTVTADDVVQRTEVMPEPWFLLAAFNAPHVPHHVPPANLVHTPPTQNCNRDPAGCFDAMTEAVDTEIGRMLSEIDPAVLARTTIVLLADNGAPEEVIRPPFDPDRSKGSLFDGGVRVPFIVAGPWVSQRGSSSEAFVNVVDLFATITEVAEVPALTAWDGQPLRTDSVSFAHLLQDPSAPALPPRDLFVYSEMFHPLGAPPYRNRQRMVRAGYAKIIRDDGVDELFLYDGSPLEGPDLTDGGAAPLRPEAFESMVLTDLLELVEADLVYEGP